MRRSEKSRSRAEMRLERSRIEIAAPTTNSQRISQYPLRSMHPNAPVRRAERSPARHGWLRPDRAPPSKGRQSLGQATEIVPAPATKRAQFGKEAGRKNNRMDEMNSRIPDKAEAFFLNGSTFAAPPPILSL